VKLITLYPQTKRQLYQEHTQHTGEKVTPEYPLPSEFATYKKASCM
jgi:hypothetical protein